MADLFGKEIIAIADNIIENDTTDTWFAKHDPVVIGEMLPPGYSFSSFLARVIMSMVVSESFTKRK